MTAILNGGRGIQTNVLNVNHQRTIPAKVDLIWFSGFRGEDLNMIFFYQNMPYLHNRYKSNERTFSQNFVSLLISMHLQLIFELIFIDDKATKGQLKKFLFSVAIVILNWTQFEKETMQGLSQLNLVQ
jgi:hypothetical protein